MYVPPPSPPPGACRGLCDAVLSAGFLCISLWTHPASVAGCACKLSPPGRRHRKKTGTQRSNSDSVPFVLSRDYLLPGCRSQKGRAPTSLCIQMFRVETFPCYFRAGFDIIKIRSHHNIFCNWTFLWLYLPFEKLSNMVGSDFFFKCCLRGPLHTLPSLNHV